MINPTAAPFRVPEKRVSFVFGKSAPDAVRFLKLQCVVEALPDDGALGTDPFGLSFAPLPLEPAFTVGVEKR